MPKSTLDVMYAAAHVAVGYVAIANYPERVRAAHTWLTMLYRDIDGHAMTIEQVQERLESQDT